MEQKKEFWTLGPDNVYVAGHRGLSRDYPENTLPSFEAACRAGIDQVETDVRITADGELVVIHDAAVDRTCRGTGLVKEKTLAELRCLSADNGKDAFEGVRIPTLEEFLDLMRRENMKTLDIELKEYPENGWGQEAFSIADRAIRMVEDFGFEGRFVINTFSAGLHQYLHEHYGGRLMQHVYWPNKTHTGSFADPEAPYDYAYCCCMFGPDPCNMAVPEDFAAMKARGVSPWAGAGVKTKDDTALAVARGAELITCNNADEVLRYLREMGKHA